MPWQGARAYEKERYVRGNSHSFPPLPFIFLSPLLSYCLSFSPFHCSLLTAVIVSFSLSKNIQFLPRCKGGEISTCVTFSSTRQGEESWGKSGVLMTAERAVWVMPNTGICGTRIKLFTSKTHCLLPDRAVERGGRMMEKRDELNIRKMECLRDGKREKQKEWVKTRREEGVWNLKMYPRPLREWRGRWKCRFMYLHLWF